MNTAKQELEDAKKADEEKTVLQAQLDAVKKEKQDLETKLKETEKEKQELQTKLTQAEQEKNKALEDAKQQAEQENTNLQTQLDAVKKEKQELQTKLAQVEEKDKQIEEINAKVEELEKKLAAKNTEVQKLQKENKELEAQKQPTEQPKPGKAPMYAAAVGVGLAAGLVAFIALEYTAKLEMLVTVGIAAASALAVGGITYFALKPSTQVSETQEPQNAVKGCCKA
ncbi:MAG: hypothetical protein LKM43_00295 [Wolbachia endosymbiont of Penenirmus auritus]|nr:hypothetical protein [Wolbachia endosymbiont of Penenirmus auritus]